MAEGTSFENPAYEPNDWKDDNDDDYATGANETQPFLPGSASAPHQPLLVKKLKCKECNMKSAGCLKHLCRNPFYHRRTDTEWTSVDCCKDLFPNMSSREQQAMYSSSGQLPVKFLEPAKTV